MPTTEPFIIRVPDDSMSPRYANGEFALIEPNTAPLAGDDVLIRLKSGEWLLRRLEKLGDRIQTIAFHDFAREQYKPDEIEHILHVAHPLPAKRLSARLSVAHLKAMELEL